MRVQHLGRIHSGFSRDHRIRTRETLSTHYRGYQGAQFLRHIQPDSHGGITRAQQLAIGGVQPLRGTHPGFVQINRGPIVNPKDTERVLEVKAHCLGQISSKFKEFSHQGKHSNLAIVVV
jgi:hypothetical protein